jgi:hypothetical protein
MVGINLIVQVSLYLYFLLPQLEDRVKVAKKHDERAEDEK